MFKVSPLTAINDKNSTKSIELENYEFGGLDLRWGKYFELFKIT